MDKLKEQLEIMYSHKYPLDGPWYHERSAHPRLSKIDIPAYFGTGWYMNELHLKGAFDGYDGTGAIPKRMLVGPKPWPIRPWAGYHYEMLRWYEQWLKGMDTRVMEGAPIQLYIQGDPGLDHAGAGSWRPEHEWPLERTQWQELYLGGPAGGHEGTLSDSAGAEQTRGLDRHERRQAPRDDTREIDEHRVRRRAQPFAARRPADSAIAVIPTEAGSRRAARREEREPRHASHGSSTRMTLTRHVGKQPGSVDSMRTIPRN